MAKNHSDAQSSLQKANIWSNKIPLYMKFLNKHESATLDIFYKQAFLKLDQYWKGSKKRRYLARGDITCKSNVFKLEIFQYTSLRLQKK